MNEETKNLLNIVKKLAGKQLITNDEFQAGLTDIVNAFAQHRAASKDINKETKDTLNLIVKQVNQEHDRILKEVEAQSKESSKEASASLKQALKDIQSLADEMNAMFEDFITMRPKDGEKGDDADEEVIVEKVLAKLPPVKELEEETGESIVDKINKLNTEPENQIDAKHIRNLPKFIDRVIGGGVRLLSQLLDVSITLPQNGEVLTYDSTLARWKNASAGAASMATHYAETPNEAIDGARVAFTVDHTMTFVIGIYLNGQFIHPDQYSYTGVTITFNSALPEEFATSSFTVVYY